MDISKIIKKIHLKRNGKFLGWGSGPEADWGIIFFSALILATFIILFSVSLFLKINSGEVEAEEVQVRPRDKTLNVLLLEKTVNYYETKAKRLEEIKSSKPRIPDPSI